MQRLLLSAFITLALVSSARAAVLEVPQNGGYVSGVGFISGWKCPPNDNLTAVIDGGAPIALASGIGRGDTATACGNDGRNGYIAQFNWGLLGDGNHTIAVRQNGQTFAVGTFRVTTFGKPFMTGVSGTYTLQDFPTAGRTARIEWSQGAQNFVITGTSGSGPITPTPTPKPQPTAKPTPPPAGCPASGPIRDLRVDCSDSIFFYTRNGVIAGLSSDGDIVALCITSISSEDIICSGGDVLSATTFDLAIANLNGGPYVPLGAGSGGSISASGQSLSFTMVIDGERFDFPGLSYSSRSALGAATTGAESVSASTAAMLDAMRVGAVVGAQSSGADVAEEAASIAELLERMRE